MGVFYSMYSIVYKYAKQIMKSSSSSSIASLIFYTCIKYDIYIFKTAYCNVLAVVERYAKINIFKMHVLIFIFKDCEGKIWEPLIFCKLKANFYWMYLPQNKQ